MEYLDIVDESGLPIGQVISRQEAHDNGVRHRTAHVWVIRENENRVEVLLQKRSEAKESFPGMFDTSSAGHIPAGEAPIPSAIRELSEELGITATPDQLHYAGMMHIQYEKTFHNKLFRDNEVTWVFVYREPVDINTLTLQQSEVSEVRWFDLDAVWNEIQKGDRSRFCMPTQGLRVLREYLATMNTRKNEIVYHKLVRDRIPEIIQSSGKSCDIQILSEEDYLRMIDAKLDEELAEYHKDQNIEELADLLEVIRAAAAARGYTVEDLERVRAEKVAQRGGFEERILLKSVYEN